MEKVWGWNRPTEVLENWRDLAAKHQIPNGGRYLKGYEDDLDVVVNALKKNDKNDKDRPHLCRAIWRRKRARRRHVDRQKKLECCEEERAPPAKPKSKHLNWERVVDDEKAAWLRLAGSNGRHTVQLVPKGSSSQDRRLARSFCLGESKRARERVEDSSVSGTVGPQEGFGPRPALLRNHSAPTKRGIRAVALGTQQLVDPERRCGRLGGDHQ